VAGLERRLGEAEAALATLDEVVNEAGNSLIERDGAIVRLIYTFEAVWKACQQLLSEREGIDVASPNATVRAARRLGWLSDEDAQGAIRVNRDRNLAVHMYRGRMGAEIAEHLAAHAALLHRWLGAIHQAAATR
jgi:uncharacterized protein YutE (UPF0331/DUF86 family)